MSGRSITVKWVVPGTVRNAMQPDDMTSGVCSSGEANSVRSGRWMRIGQRVARKPAHGS